MFFSEDQIFNMTAKKYITLNVDEKNEVIDRITEYDCDETIVGYIELLTSLDKVNEVKSLKNHLHILIVNYCDIEKGHLKDHIFRICGMEFMDFNKMYA